MELCLVDVNSICPSFVRTVLPPAHVCQGRFPPHSPPPQGPITRDLQTGWKRNGWVGIGWRELVNMALIGEVCTCGTHVPPSVSFACCPPPPPCSLEGFYDERISIGT